MAEQGEQGWSAPVGMPAVPLPPPTEPAQIPVPRLPEIPVPRPPADPPRVTPAAVAPAPITPSVTPSGTASAGADESVGLMPQRLFGLAAVVCGAWLVHHAAVTAIVLVQGEGSSLAGLRDRLSGSATVAVVGLWAAATVWSVFAAVNTRRVTSAGPSPVIVAMAWMLPAALAAISSVDRSRSSIGLFVALVALGAPAASMSACAGRVRRVARPQSWPASSLTWFVTAGLWGFATVATVNLTAQAHVGTARVAAIAATIVGAIWCWTSTALFAAVESDLRVAASPAAQPMNPLIAGGGDPMLVMNALRSAQEPAPTEGPPLLPMAWLRWLWIGCLVVGIAAAGRAAALFLDLDRARRSAPGTPVPGELWFALVVMGVGFLVAAAAYVAWGVVVLANARRRGAPRTDSLRWAIGSLVPLVNLVMPFMALRGALKKRPRASRAIDIWQASTVVLFVVSYTTNRARRRMVRLEFENATYTAALAIVDIVAPLLCATVAFIAMRRIEQSLGPRRSEPVSGTGPPPAA